MVEDYQFALKKSSQSESNRTRSVLSWSPQLGLSWEFSRTHLVNSERNLSATLARTELSLSASLLNHFIISSIGCVTSNIKVCYN